MSRIRILSDQVANQIAAGEVVERPSSVLKELLENALDAGATRLEVRWEEGGRRLLEVADDGCGMERDDLYLALERHATSKVRSADDLGHLETFGFRGEALPSIASVTRFELHSAEAQGQGWRLRCEFGVIREVLPAPRSRGTTVTIRDLFAQLPARRRFLKSPETEHAHLWNTVTRMALATPEVHWTIRCDKGSDLILPPLPDAAGRLAPLLGERLGSLVPFREGDPPWTLRGYLSPLELSFRDRNHLYLFVNGRAVRDRLLLSALAAGWEGFFAKGSYPAAVVFLDLPPEAVDVNVHPTKAEVRFRDPQRIFPWVSRVLREAWSQLRGDAASVLDLPPRPLEPEFEAPVRTQAAAHPHLWKDSVEPAVRVLEEVFQARLDQPYRPAPEVPAPSAEPSTVTPELRFLGAFDHTYLLVESRTGPEPELWILDQHAAHERVLYERLFTRRHAPAVQPLMPARALHLGPATLTSLRPFLEEMNLIGLECDALGEDTLVVRGLPDFLADRDPLALVEALQERLERGSRLDLDAFRKELNAELACRAAIKKHLNLDAPLALQLVRDLMACQVPQTCPHGRPILKKLTRTELERSFGRRS
nr:DNA mismatch repair endonuclease MutL [uncultured Holophaga sp.]